MKYEVRKNDYLISTHKSKLNTGVIHNFLRASYWARGISYDAVKKSIKNSLCFGLYYNDLQIGFARVITDFTTFAYIADVFINDPHKNKGLSKWLIKVILDYPSLQGLKRWMLSTKDAHNLYKKFGFRSPQYPNWIMEISNLDIYSKP